MFGFHEKRRLQRILYSRYTLGLLCVPVAFMWYAAHNAHQGERESNTRKVELQAELAALEERAAVLEGDIGRLQDPYGVEAELRKRYDVAREGEVAIVLVEKEKDTEQSVPEPVPELSMWDRLWAWF